MSQPISTPITPSFDPRLVPVVGVDSHLPPVAPDRLTPQALRARWQQPITWHPELREEPRFSDRKPTLAAVLVGLVMRDELQVLLTERTAHLPTHAGQVAFPGGKVDADDADVMAAALREAHEEVGMPHTAAEVLGTLHTYTTGTGFVVTPVVALLAPDVQLHPNPGEVASVFEVPLSFLMNPANHRRHAANWQGVRREWLSMPYHDMGAGGEAHGIERFIWGATAGMLRNLYRFLMA